MRVSSAELNRRFGEVQARAQRGPVVVTHHGRPRLVLLTTESFSELTRIASPALAHQHSDRSSRRSSTASTRAMFPWIKMRFENRQSHIGALSVNLGIKWSDDFGLRPFPMHLRDWRRVSDARSKAGTFRRRMLNLNSFETAALRDNLSFTNAGGWRRHRLRQRHGASELRGTVELVSARQDAIMNNLRDRMFVTLDRDGKITSWSWGPNINGSVGD